MKSFKQFINEIDTFQDHLDVDHYTERTFMRTMAEIFNDALGKQEDKKTEIISNIPIKITFGSNNPQVIDNIKAVKFVGKNHESTEYDDGTTKHSKADVIIIKHDDSTVPISLKAENSKWGKARRYVRKLHRKYFVDGSRTEDKVVAEVPKDIAENAIFGNDILPDGFVLKATKSDYWKSWNKTGDKSYKVGGIVIKSLEDIPEKYAPRVEIYKTNPNPDILQKNKVSSSITHEKE